MRKTNQPSFTEQCDARRMALVEGIRRIDHAIDRADILAMDARLDIGRIVARFGR